MRYKFADSKCWNLQGQKIDAKSMKEGIVLESDLRVLQVSNYY